MAFLGATVFFAAAGPCRVMSLEKKKFQLEKRQKDFEKIIAEGTGHGQKGSYKHNAPDLWGRGSMCVWM